jgi:hypothetical protein
MTMAKPNYRFDKRQREIAKKQKQEEKRLKKLARSAEPDAGGATEPANEAPSTPSEKTL